MFFICLCKRYAKADSCTFHINETVLNFYCKPCAVLLQHSRLLFGAKDVDIVARCMSHVNNVHVI